MVWHGLGAIMIQYMVWHGLGVVMLQYTVWHGLGVIMHTVHGMAWPWCYNAHSSE